MALLCVGVMDGLHWILVAVFNYHTYISQIVGHKCIARHFKVSIISLESVNLCRNGWKFHNGSCYAAYDYNYNYEQATTDCGQREAHLATISNAAENKFVLDLVLAMNAKDDRIEDSWIGKRVQPIGLLFLYA